MTYQPFPDVLTTQMVNEPSLTGIINAPNQTLVIPVPSGMSNWLVQATGTFAGNCISELSADGGLNYVAVNSRQSLMGRIANNFGQPGVFRGCVSGGTHFRIRSTTWTSGTADITIRLGLGSSPSFQNSIVEVRGLQQYYASRSGGTTAFAVSTGPVILPTAGGTVAILNNPVGSGVFVYVNTFSMSSNNSGRWDRMRGVVVTPTGPSQASANRGGGTNTTPINLYLPSNATATGGILAETLYIGAFTPHTEKPEGAAVIGPGQSTSWAFFPDRKVSLAANIEAAFALTYWLQSDPVT